MVVAEKARSLQEALAYAGRPEKGPEPALSTGWPEVDAALGGGLPCGLHEWFGLSPAGWVSDRPGPRRRGSARREAWTPPICVLVHLAWQLVESASAPGSVVWVGPRCFPYPRVLVRCDEDDTRLLRQSVLVSADDAASRLWAMDLALRSPAVLAVVADGCRLDMAATRRLQLLAKRQDKCVLLARPAEERGELSAAQSRWHIAWYPQADPSARTAISPRWSVHLLRCKGMQPAGAIPAWVLEWDRGQSGVRVSASMAGSAGDAPAATLVG